MMQGSILLQSEHPRNKNQGKNCFICNRVGISSRKNHNLFTPVKHGSDDVTPSNVLEKILKLSIDENTTPSAIICKKCIKICTDYHELTEKLGQIESDTKELFENTVRKNTESLVLKPNSPTKQTKSNSPSSTALVDPKSTITTTKLKSSYVASASVKMNSTNDQNRAETFVNPKQTSNIITEQYFDDNDVNMVEIISEDYSFADHNVDEEGIEHDDIEYDHGDYVVDESGEEEIVETTKEDDDDEHNESYENAGEEHILIEAAENSLGKQIKIKSEPSDDAESGNLAIKTEKKLELYSKEGDAYFCKLCPPDENAVLILYNNKSIVVHMKIQHDEKIFVCEDCDAYFRKRTELNVHMDEHTSNVQDGEFQCVACQRGFNSYRQLRIHRRSHMQTARTWSCEHCNKKYGSKNLLDQHVNMHTGARPFKCPECGKDFASKYTLSSHIKTHAKRERAYNCKFCSKSFYSNQNLIQHEKIHSGLRDFACTDCGKAFISQHNLDVHKIVHTGYKPFICRICGKAFARRAEIKDHERTHTGERPYSCDICGTSFAQRSNLQSHKRATHLNDKRHKCDKCDRSFKRRRLLDYHIKATHTGERPYKCKECESSFVYPEHYKKHIKIHTGVKPFKCEVCSRSFHSRDNRNAHRFVHSDKKPYECIDCGKGFMRKPQLYNHMQQQGHTNDTIIVNQPQIDGSPEMYEIVNQSRKTSSSFDSEELAFAEEEVQEEYEDVIEEQLADENEEQLIYDGQVQFSGDNIATEEYSNDPLIETHDLNAVMASDNNMIITNGSHIIENGDGTVQLVQIRLPPGSDGKDKLAWVNLVSQ